MLHCQLKNPKHANVQAQSMHTTLNYTKVGSCHSQRSPHRQIRWEVHTYSSMVFTHNCPQALTPSFQVQQVHVHSGALLVWTIVPQMTTRQAKCHLILYSSQSTN